MDKLCAKCGKRLLPDQSFCDNCGSAWTPSAETVSAANPITAAPQPGPQQVVSPARTSGTGSSSKILLIVAIVVIALGIGGWVFMRHPHSSAVSLTTNSSSSSTAVTSSTSAQQASRVAGVPATSEASTATVSSTSGEASPAATAAATEAAANSKPCSLVTRAEMEQILGLKIVKMTSDEMRCAYFTDDTTSATVDTTWTGGKAAMAETKGFENSPGLFEPVPGIGDEAYMQAASVLHILKGDTYVVVNARVYPNDHETESAIARKAMEKLK